METTRNCSYCGTLLAAEAKYCPNCGTGQIGTDAAIEGPGSTWESILPRLAAATAPRYRVLKLLGYGGMAGVYLAEEPKLGRRVAIKLMSPGLMIDPGLVSRFNQEARTTAQLHHPNIVTIYDVDERDGLHYFVMAYVPGSPLSTVLSHAQAPLPIAAVTHWLAQVGSGLDYAHRTTVVHRDVKPGNILFDGDANALVTDFGIAKVADEPSLTRTGMLVGTPTYMSPEQCTSGVVTGASDQYSLGIVTYEMLAGKPPFSGQTVAVLHAHVHEDPPPLLERRPDCPPELAAAVGRMLAKNPEDRFPSIAVALAELGVRPLNQTDPLRRDLQALVRPEGGFMPVSTRLPSPLPTPSVITDPRAKSDVPPSTETPASLTPVVETPEFQAPTPSQPPVSNRPTPYAGGRTPGVGASTYSAAGDTGGAQEQQHTTPWAGVAAAESQARPPRWLFVVGAGATLTAVAAIVIAVALGGGETDAPPLPIPVGGAATGGQTAEPNTSPNTPATGATSTAQDGATAPGADPPVAGGDQSSGNAGASGEPGRVTTAGNTDQGQSAGGAGAGASGSSVAGANAVTGNPTVSPRLGVLRITGTLPAGGELRLTAPGAASRAVRPGAYELEPGLYRIEASAAGYQALQEGIDVFAGDTAVFQIALTAVPTPATRPPTRDSTPPTQVSTPPAGGFDRATATTRINESLQSFAATWETRNMDQVAAAFPGATAEWRRQWSPIIEDRQNAADLRADVSNVGSPVFEGDTARVQFTLGLSFRDLRNAQQSPEFRFAATFMRSGEQWLLRELTQVQ